MTSDIIKNDPMPPPRKKHACVDVETINRMLPGHSIIHENPSQVVAVMRRLGWRTVTQKQPDGRYRIWRDNDVIHVPYYPKYPESKRPPVPPRDVVAPVPVPPKPVRLPAVKPLKTKPSMVERHKRERDERAAQLSLENKRFFREFNSPDVQMIFKAIETTREAGILREDLLAAVAIWLKDFEGVKEFDKPDKTINWLLNNGRILPKFSQNADGSFATRYVGERFACPDPMPEFEPDEPPRPSRDDMPRHQWRYRRE